CGARPPGLRARAHDMSTLTRLIEGLVARVRGRDVAPATSALPGASAVNGLFEECLRLSAGGELGQVADCYRRLLQREPLHAKGRNNLGIVYQRLGDFARAALCFEQAARDDPALAEPHVNLGNLHDIRGDPDTALPCYRRALAIDPGHVHAHCCLAQAL